MKTPPKFKVVERKHRVVKCRKREGRLTWICLKDDGEPKRFSQYFYEIPEARNAGNYPEGTECIFTIKIPEKKR